MPSVLWRNNFKKCNLIRKTPWVRSYRLNVKCAYVSVVEHYLLFFTANKFSTLFTLSLFAAPYFSSFSFRVQNMCSEERNLHKFSLNFFLVWVNNGVDFRNVLREMGSRECRRHKITRWLGFQHNIPISPFFRVIMSLIEI